MSNPHITVLRGILSDGTIAFHAVFAKAFRSLPVGVFLSQAYFWQENRKFKSKDTHQEIDGKQFFTKTAKDWFEETSLSVEQLAKVRDTLCTAGILQEKLFGNPARLYYHIDFEALVSVINRYLESGISGSVDNRNKNRFKTQTRRGKKPKLGSVKNQTSYIEESIESLEREREANVDNTTPAPESQNLKAEFPQSPKVAPKGSFPSGPAQFPAASPEAWKDMDGVIKVVDPALPGVVIVDGAGPLETSKELRYSDYPMPADAIELKDALSTYFEQRPQEWQKLIETAQVRWEKQKVSDTVIEFCLHQQKESNLKRTFREYQAALTIWFRRQKSFDSQRSIQPTQTTQQTPPANYTSQTRH